MDVRLFLLTSLVLFSGCASPIAFIERKMLFQPAAYPAGAWNPAIIQPEDAWFTAADGTRLHGWYLRHPQPRAVALVCHGNAGNITMLDETLAILHKDHALTVMAFDYRGYGRSEGTPSEDGIFEDGRAARAWLARHEGIDERDIMVMGISLGGAVAIDLAAREGARALVISRTFTSLPAAAQHHFPWLPTKLLMTMQCDSLEKIRHYDGPVLVSHGDADEVIPFDHGLQLYSAVRGPKRFYRHVGGGHNDLQPDEYRAVLDEFIASLPPVKPSIATTSHRDSQ